CTAGHRCAKEKSKAATNVLMPFFGKQPDNAGKLPVLVVGREVSNDWDQHDDQVSKFAAQTTFTGTVERHRLSPRTEKLFREAYPDQDFTSVWELQEGRRGMPRELAPICLAVGAVLLVVALVVPWLYFRWKWRPARVKPITLQPKGQS